MSKDKQNKKDKENKYKQFSKVGLKEDTHREQIVMNGKCLSCKKPMMKNVRRCNSCLRKKRQQKKASRRGKSKNYYVEEYQKNV